MAKKIILEGKPNELSNNQVYIKKGDSLSKLAERLTGKSSNWQEIAKANNISNPNLIKPGQVITIPAVPASEKRDKSKTYPKTIKGKPKHKPL